jgi:hypothetical protein
MCQYLCYPRPLHTILKERFTALESRFVQLWDHKEESELDDWVNLLSDLLCEVCYLHEFDWFEIPTCEYYSDKLSEYASMIQTTYKI